MSDAQAPRGHGGPNEGLAFAEALARLLSEGRRVAIATVVKGRGSHPRAPGARMLVPDAGPPELSIGGGPLEATVLADCRAVLAGAEPGVRRYDLAESGDDAVGMTCGGSVEVFVDVAEPPTRLFVFGAGHVGRAVAAAARVAGLALTVVDDRSEWLDTRAFPQGTTLHRCGRGYDASLPDIGPGACVAVMTRCHDTDMEVLAQVASAPARPRYVGMMGSRRKVLRAFDRLEERGVPRDWLDAVHAPIGLAIGAETPGEIGIAVVAEIVGALRGAPARPAAMSTTERAALAGPRAKRGS